jgi:transcriptional regulator with XRE-family HTH domain
MPRGLRPPPFPATPGSWLAAYRYRGTANGERPSAEQLSRLMGVSGATIRRWESGQIRPTREDLRRFASVCGLAPLEREFMLRCFASVDHEAPPSDEAYEHLLSRSLESALPTFVMDSLFYVRGWNSHQIALSGRQPGQVPMNNAICALFDPKRTLRLDPVLDDQFTPWLRNFWLLTAELCGTPPYIRLLDELRTLGDFEQRWWDLALTQKMADTPVNLPTIYHSPQFGVFRVFMTRVILPPTYFLREYVPIDDTARHFVSELRSKGRPDIGRNEHCHWSEEQ